MKIGYCSDLHLEFYSSSFRNTALEILRESQDKVDILIIAGDLHSDFHKRKRFLEKLKPNFLFVPGNHDFRKSTVYDTFSVNEDIVSSTLWTNLQENPLTEAEVIRWWDFREIRYWTIQECKQRFYSESKRILESECPIVVTHFAPSMKSVEEKYKDAIIDNPYFCNDLDDLILKSNKKLWIHGHVHSQHDYMIGDCRVVANPWGYPGEVDYLKEVKIIEINEGE